MFDTCCVLGSTLLWSHAATILHKVRPSSRAAACRAANGPQGHCSAVLLPRQGWWVAAARLVLHLSYFANLVFGRASAIAHAHMQQGGHRCGCSGWLLCDHSTWGQGGSRSHDQQGIPATSLAGPRGAGQPRPPPARQHCPRMLRLSNLLHCQQVGL